MIKIFIFTLFVVFSSANYIELPWAEWSHHHLVWLNGPTPDQNVIEDMVQGYLDHNIKVGAVNIDSDWAKTFNDF